MKKIAITGISGYIGSRLLARLEGMAGVERVVGIDLKPPPFPSPKLQFCPQDILEPLDAPFSQNGVDSAVHLAFVVRPGQDRARARRVNLGGARNFLDACRRSQVRHILYLSSHTVYGAHPDNPVPLTEEAPLRPNPGFQYSWDKAESDALFRDFAAAHPHIGVAVVRACVVLGPGADNAITRSLFQPVMIRVRGYNPPLQFLHEDDLAELMITLLARGQAGVFNAAGEGSLGYSQVAALAGRRCLPLPGSLLRPVMALSWNLRLQRQSPPAGLRFIMHPIILSTAKLRQEVGFRFQHSSRQAVEAFVASRWGRGTGLRAGPVPPAPGHS